MFRCAKCFENKDGAPLKIASRDGHTLHDVCPSHVPDEHGVGHHYEHNYTVKDKDGNDVATSHVVRPNADGVIRTIVFEDLK